MPFLSAHDLWEYEIPKPEKVRISRSDWGKNVPKVVYVNADHDIGIYAINRRNKTTDGFLGLFVQLCINTHSNASQHWNLHNERNKTMDGFLSLFV